MSNGLDQQDWIPLVEPVGEKFILSKQLLELVGPIGWDQNLWEVKAFVAHLITDFEDGYEHFLDNEDDGATPEFHVSLAFCEYLAKTFKEEYLPLSSDWYHQLARAKLLSLRVPKSLVLEAKLAWFVKYHDPKLLAHVLVDLPRQKGTPVPEDIMQQLTEALQAETVPIIWLALEEIAKNLLTSRILSEDELHDLMDLNDQNGYNDYVTRYIQYHRRTRDT